MKIKVMALCLSMMLLGGIATSSVAAVVGTSNHIVLVDDKDKTKKAAKKDAKTEKSATAKECATKKSCCGSSTYEKSCKDKKADPDKK